MISQKSMKGILCKLSLFPEVIWDVTLATSAQGVRGETV